MVYDKEQYKELQAKIKEMRNDPYFKERKERMEEYANRVFNLLLGEASFAPTDAKTVLSKVRGKIDGLTGE